MSAPRIAVNALPYWSRDGKSKEVFARALADFAAIGYAAVKADVPDGMSPAEYLDWIGGYGLAPSVSLFSSAFDETVDISAEVERAKAFAAVQLELGLDRTMVSSLWVEARRSRPAVGADFRPDRLARAIESCGIVCQALRSEGLRPLHHSHVGGVFETEAEISTLLDQLGPDVIGIGPDTGHLRWAGTEPGPFIARYADRIGAIHLKDCLPDYLDPAAAGDLDYGELSHSRRLWCEPGLGVVDFDAVLAAMPDDYDGDFMIEIDVPSVDSYFESHRIAYEWAEAHLPVQDGS
ncbi:MAG TPA: sugar phosphate isomerase/epimerase [Propionibacteriaceae bacterium]|nr:sugar phosphate isomerase/epimerase [Propionibacteriaceae bacterium]